MVIIGTIFFGIVSKMALGTISTGPLTKVKGMTVFDFRTFTFLLRPFVAIAILTAFAFALTFTTKFPFLFFLGRCKGRLGSEPEHESRNPRTSSG